MPRLALQPASTGDAVEHYRDTIERTQSLAKLEPFLKPEVRDELREAYPDGQATVWGGVSRNRSKIAKLRPGDIVWFYRAGEFISECRVTAVVLDAPALANELWDPNPKRGSFEHVFFLTRPRPIRVPWDPVRDYKGYQSNYVPQSIHVLERDESMDILRLFGPDTAGASDSAAKKAVEALEAEVEESYGRGQGHASSAELRKVIEEYAIRSATVYFERSGFEVEEHGAPYDLLCTRRDREVFVEVKGTQTPGERVFLTRNEVHLAQDDTKESVLYVQHSIDVEVDGDVLKASGGHSHVLWPWDPSDDDLSPVTFTYRVPGT